MMNELQNAPAAADTLRWPPQAPALAAGLAPALAAADTLRWPPAWRR